jgi:hypothetical protein
MSWRSPSSRTTPRRPPASANAASSARAPGRLARRAPRPEGHRPSSAQSRRPSSTRSHNRAGPDFWRQKNDRRPVPHIATITRPGSGTTSSMRNSKNPRPSLRAPGAVPCAISSDSRTSTSTAPRACSASASFGETMRIRVLSSATTHSLANNAVCCNPETMPIMSPSTGCGENPS